MRSRNEYSRKALAVFPGVLLAQGEFSSSGQNCQVCVNSSFLFFLSAVVVAAQSWCRIRKLVAFFLYLKIFYSA